MKVRNRRKLTVNPFVSEAQRRACYAKQSAGGAGSWDCSEWSKATSKRKLPKRVKKPTTNAKRKAPNPLRIDPTRTVTLRRHFIAQLRRQFALLKGRIVKLIVDEDALGLAQPTHEMSVSNSAAGVQAIKDEVAKYTEDQLEGLKVWVNGDLGLAIIDRMDWYDKSGDLDPAAEIGKVAERQWGSDRVIYQNEGARPMGEDWLTLNEAHVDSIRQEENWYCGVAVVSALTGMDQEEAETILGTTRKDGTAPEAIAGVLGSDAEEDMSLDRLRELTDAGTPVVCAIQAWGSELSKDKDQSGHYVIVTDIDDEGDTQTDAGEPSVHFMDPAIGKGRHLTLTEFEGIWHDEDADGREWNRLGIPANKYVANARQWQFNTDPEKLRAFQAWLKQQIEATLTGQTQQQMWDKYIHDGFRKGAGRSFDDVRSKRATNLPREPLDPQRKMDFYDGTREEFLRSSFAQPVAREKVELLAGRSFDELKNMTADMGNKVGRALVDGIVQGKGPHEVARDLVNQVDISRPRAETIARTELIRAHAEGQLTALEGLGVEEVGVQVEFMVTEDEVLCPECEALSGSIMSIDEARGVIPVHPS